MQLVFMLFFKSFFKGDSKAIQWFPYSATVNLCTIAPGAKRMGS